MVTQQGSDISQIIKINAGNIYIMPALLAGNAGGFSGKTAGCDIGDNGKRRYGRVRVGVTGHGME